MQNVSVIGRAAAIAAVLVAAVAVVVLLLGSGGKNYTVKAEFLNASQLVKGNLVQVSGREVGKVKSISLTDNGLAVLTLSIADGYAPLREGTDATVRASSLSGIANRYIDLRLGPANGRSIPSGGSIAPNHTTTAVDLDEIFNIFGPRERKALSGVIRGSATQYAGRGDQANKGLLYLNPSIASTTALFSELNRDTPTFRRFITANAKLVTDVAERSDDLSGVIDHLATTVDAIGRQRTALADAISQLPDFMRRANTTFVNLRATLDDLTPLVNESKPVAKKLRPFLRELRPLAEDARPTVRELATLIKKSGANNDLIDLTNSNVPVRDIAIGPVHENGTNREGAFPASVKAVSGATPELSSARPYAPDLIGWFDDFSHSGVQDALGGVSRVGLYANLFTVVGNLPQIINNPLLTNPTLRAAGFQTTAQTRFNNRCPGSMERTAPDNSNPFVPSDVRCDPTQLPLGP
ncbi:MAG: phospholipid/cholesterol/gamma-HCH transport system substrate-binding protein [Solirubrobacteraceae bacterium]|nr:phospholipid/cholesterol/gamma-HCH transport system substrate-binding protein [Solirubrobacteraceae bacterium]